MEHLTIDMEKCVGCNRCVQDCPMGIPAVDSNGVYYSDDANAEICIYCGHCVAVCPAGAIKLNPMDNTENLKEMADYGIVPFGLTQHDCIPTQINGIPTVSSMEALIRSRRMTRSFKPDLVDHTIIEHIINDVLVFTPSGHNTRGYQALIVEGREKLDQLTTLSVENFKRLLKANGLHSFDKKVFERIITAWDQRKDRVFRTARQAIVVHCKSSIVPADPAVKVMLTYFEMLANTMGIGTVWAGYFMVAANDPSIKQYLGVPEDNTIYGAMMFGYPEFTYDLIPKRPEIGINYI